MRSRISSQDGMTLSQTSENTLNILQALLFRIKAPWAKNTIWLFPRKIHLNISSADSLNIEFRLYWRNAFNSLQDISSISVCQLCLQSSNTVYSFSNKCNIIYASPAKICNRYRNPKPASGYRRMSSDISYRESPLFSHLHVFPSIEKTKTKNFYISTPLSFNLPIS